MLLILKSLYFFLPAYFANMTPVFVRKIPFLDGPINKKLFGKNKTWRGVLAATIVGGLVFWLQQLAYSAGFVDLALIDYADFGVSFGFLLGLGAIIGDLVKSYYKRKAEIPPGERWPGFDQLDFVIGGLTLGFFVYVPAAEVMLILIIASPLLHIAANHIGYWLGMREKKF